jgi:hypothetical protein
MAFKMERFIVHNWTPGPSGDLARALASYTTDDAATAVAADDYFNAAAALLPVGSQILVAADMDGTPVPVHYVVTDNDGETVTVAAAA